MRVVAIMVLRNEERCLPRCLEHLAAQGLQVAAIDNASDDGTREILESMAPEVVVHVESAPFNGTFEWLRLLAQAERMWGRLEADWFHLNSADEQCDSDRPGETLAEAFRRIDAAGYTAVNFDEFVFVPTEDGVQVDGRAFDDVIRSYYYYAPTPLRQMRSWKNRPGVSSLESAGHRLSGPDLRVYPVDLPLRHYIALDRAHLRHKYGARAFPEEELARGSHGNRIGMDVEGTSFPPADRLKRYRPGQSAPLDRTDPWSRHFWERADEL